jgi:DNA-binding response OmpR family regulator
MYVKPRRFAKASILVLESDSELCASLRNCLADEGYRLADSAHDSASAIDLVIAGIHPGVDPAAALPDHSAPVIALVDRSAWLGFEFFDAANAVGAVAVLRRPFPRSALLRLIGAVLSQADDSVSDCRIGDEEHAGLAELLLELEKPNFV